MAQYDVDLRDYWRIIRKRKALIAIMVVVVGLCSYGFAKFREPRALYEAQSALKIDQFANLALIFTGGFWRQSENIDTHAYIITSFPVLAQTAQDLGWIPAGLTDEDIRNKSDYLAAVQRLKEIVQAVPQKGTNIINIQVASESAEEAAAIANAFAGAYRTYNIREKNKKTFETKAFIEKQLRTTSDKLRSAEEELQLFKETYGLIALDAQTQNTLNKLYGVESEYEKIKQERAEIESHLEDIRSGKGRASLLKSSAYATPEGSPLNALKAQLSELSIRRQTLLINFTAKHPKVREVDDQIRAVLEEISRELRSLLSSFQAREADLAQRLQDLRQENLSLPEKGLQLIRLKREVDLQESLYSQLKEKYQETLIQESGRVEEVSIVKPAVAPERPYNIPSKLMIVTTGALLGLILGIVLAFLAEMFDTSMGTIEDVEDLLKVPVLGVIPQLWADTKGRKRDDQNSSRKDRMKDLVTHYDPKSQGAEAFRGLRTNLQFLRLENRSKLYLITSSFVQEGKTFNAVNLALSLAQAGNRILLVDGDLRRPLVHKVFGLTREPGITDFVLGNCQWSEAANTISDIMLGDFNIDDLLQTPGMDNLHIMTAGAMPPNPTEILNSVRFKQFLQEARKAYDFIFVDAPPILPVADAAELAPQVDGVFLVYTVGKIGRGVLKRAKTTLENVDARILGVILNHVKPDAGPEYLQYQNQYYYENDDHPGRGTRRKEPSQAGRSRSAGITRLLGGGALAAALLLVAIGMFWPELQPYLPEWLTVVR